MIKLRYFDRNYKEKGICNKETGEKGEHSERCKKEIIMRWDGMGWSEMGEMKGEIIQEMEINWGYASILG